MMIAERQIAVHQPATLQFPVRPKEYSVTGDDSPPLISFLPNGAALDALLRTLPSNTTSDPAAIDGGVTDAYSSDHFRMYDLKVQPCVRVKSHDWTECPFAHPGEKARRRDPRVHRYSAAPCPDFRSGDCPKADACGLAHGVFESWLHPARYRTQPCKDGPSCGRRVCFFAHSPEQLRVSSPGSDSPPASPISAANSVNALSRSLGSRSMAASLRQLQLTRVKSMPVNRSGFHGLPSTPNRGMTRPGVWDRSFLEGDGEIPMERVESGRNLRTRMFQKISEENPLGVIDPYLDPNDPHPDVGWVSDLLG